MKFEGYDIYNFIADEFFIQWVKNPCENTNHFWEKWLEQHPEKREVVFEAANFIRSVKYPPSSALSDQKYVETFEEIMRMDQHSTIRKSTYYRRKFLSFRNIAASFLILFSLWAEYESFKYKPPIEELPVVTWISRSNSSGQKSVINLPDGSRIHMNSESSIEFPSSFSDTLRRVTLQGEAFFEINKENRPFIVETGGSTIQVLGTSFNVNQIQGSLYVALVTGKVKINDTKGNQVILNPREMLVMEENGLMYKTDFDPKSVIGWKDNNLIFEKSKLVDVKQKLERWYGVKITFQGSFDKNWNYSGIYQNEMLENVLRGICITSGFTYKVNNKDITITNPK